MALQSWHMVSWARDARDLKAFQLYDKPYFLLDGRVAKDRCPHRGAKLSQGTARDGCVTCPFHGRRFTSTTLRTGGVTADGALWYGGSDASAIPAIPEFGDPSYRSVLMSRRLRGVSAWPLMESALDLEHVGAVHGLHLPKASSRLDRGANSVTHTFATPRFSVVLEAAFWLPFTSTLRFKLVETATGIVHAPFLLFFSLTPHGPRDVTLHVRSMRRPVVPALAALTDPFFVAVSDIPIFQDVRVVRGVDVGGMLMCDRLSSEDALIALYRAQMAERAPELLKFFSS